MRAKPVVLQRVMSGEIFSAIMGGTVSKGVDKGGLSPQRATEDEEEHDERMKVRARELEEYRKALLEYERRLRKREEEVEQLAKGLEITGEVQRKLEAEKTLEGADVEQETTQISQRIEKRTRKEGKGERDDIEERRRQLEEWIARANASFELDSFEEAVRYCDEALKIDPQDARAWCRKGDALSKNGSYSLAIECYQKAIQTKPRDERAWHAMGNALKEIGRHEEALDSYDKAIHLNWDFEAAWYDKGSLLYVLNRLAEALECFLQVLRIKPEHEMARRVKAEIELKLGQKNQTARKKAQTSTVVLQKDALERETRLEPRLEADRKDFQQGIETFRKIDIEPMGATQRVPKETPTIDGEEKGPKVYKSPSVPKEKIGKRVSRINTFIAGFDEALDGGVPKGSVVLICGAPGTMKSTLAFWILYNNALKKGVNSLYATFEHSMSSLLKQISSFQIDPHRAGDRISIFYMGFLQKHLKLKGNESDWLRLFKKNVSSLKGRKGIELLVIDSLEALEVLARFEDRRREVFRLFEWLRDLGLTSFVIAERPDFLIDGNVLQGRYEEDFLADGIFHLRLHFLNDIEVQRRLRCVKMRGTKHTTGYHAILWDDNKFKVTRALSE